MKNTINKDIILFVVKKNYERIDYYLSSFELKWILKKRIDESNCWGNYNAELLPSDKIILVHPKCEIIY